ncbi:hypothetical protein K456DRAFT_922788 [Colletotrichum gloeosporioides 23]|nr:hypothetical protein K456DRAFT_922788 [Colletotrichum gloeosporioides 23]
MALSLPTTRSPAGSSRRVTVRSDGAHRLAEGIRRQVGSELGNPSSGSELCNDLLAMHKLCTTWWVVQLRRSGGQTHQQLPCPCPPGSWSWSQNRQSERSIQVGRRPAQNTERPSTGCGAGIRIADGRRWCTAHRPTLPGRCKRSLSAGTARTSPENPARHGPRSTGIEIRAGMRWKNTREGETLGRFCGPVEAPREGKKR